MGLKIFNTLTRSLEEFVPLAGRDGRVGMYCCGPTVHDFAHIGNFRTFLFADLVRRYLEFSGYTVRHVMNVTDVDDKIIHRIQAEGSSLEDFTRAKEKAFWEDVETLRCRRPQAVPHATEHIEDIVHLISKLQERGLAYQAPDGSVYFSIAEYRKRGFQYGQLTRLNLDELRVGERVRHDEYAKESAADFALWKARHADDGPVFWSSPWGEGRPGWHIECSAMSMKLLYSSFDLHLGGEDLIFPHHEDEIAQSEGAGVQENQKRFVKYWLHAAHLLVEGKKMSKSLGNFFTVRDLLEKGFTGREIRFLLLSAHYRESFNFTLEGLHGARSSLQRLDECWTKLAALRHSGDAQPDADCLQAFESALDDDFNVSAAWGVVFEWVRTLNRGLAANELSPKEAASALATWDKIDSVFAVAPEPEFGPPDELVHLAEERQSARKARDFNRADAIRNQLQQAGWKVEDTPEGPRLKRI